MSILSYVLGVHKFDQCNELNVLAFEMLHDSGLSGHFYWWNSYFCYFNIACFYNI